MRLQPHPSLPPRAGPITSLGLGFPICHLRRTVGSPCLGAVDRLCESMCVTHLDVCGLLKLCQRAHQSVPGSAWLWAECWGCRADRLLSPGLNLLGWHHAHFTEEKNREVRRLLNSRLRFESGRLTPELMCSGVSGFSWKGWIVMI